MVMDIFKGEKDFLKKHHDQLPYEFAITFREYQENVCSFFSGIENITNDKKINSYIREKMVVAILEQLLIYHDEIFPNFSSDGLRYDIRERLIGLYSEIGISKTALEALCGNKKTTNPVQKDTELTIEKTLDLLEFLCSLVAKDYCGFGKYLLFMTTMKRSLPKKIITQKLLEYPKPKTPERQMYHEIRKKIGKYYLESYPEFNIKRLFKHINQAEKHFQKKLQNQKTTLSESKIGEAILEFIRLTIFGAGVKKELFNRFWEQNLWKNFQTTSDMVSEEK